MINLDNNKKYNVVSVSIFLKQINTSLMSCSGRVQGEVTSISKNYPKAIYFTIKDSNQEALLNCIVWRSTYEKNGVNLDVGDEIIVTGMPEVYSRNGQFSLKTQTIEYAGEGALKKAYEELKKKLRKEGLFAQERKRELVKLPNKIGVITSKAGVVMQDFSSNLGRYGFKVKTINSRVEGKDAIHEILASIKAFSKEDIEVLTIMRGGGSWESLQAFNTESVVRAIANFKCPVLTGIGHDTDVTLAELAADIGASTPTSVAQVLNESWDKLHNSIESVQIKIKGSFLNSLSNTKSIISNNSNSIFRNFQGQLSVFYKSLDKNASRIHIFYIRLEKKINKASTALQNVITSMKSSIREKKKYLHMTPLSILKFSKNYLVATNMSLSEDILKIKSEQQDMIKSLSNRLSTIEKSIKLVDPKRNLKLGYSLSYFKGKLIRSVKVLSKGHETETYLSDGKFISEIKNIK